jgi:hypothetical protein
MTFGIVTAVFGIVLFSSSTYELLSNEDGNVTDR